MCCWGGLKQSKYFYIYLSNLKKIVTTANITKINSEYFFLTSMVDIYIEVLAEGNQVVNLFLVIQCGQRAN